MRIFKSRFTPDAYGDEVKLEIGETVTYRFLSGRVTNVIIDSERMAHDECPYLGYEAIDDGERIFISGRDLIWWEGIVKSK